MVMVSVASGQRAPRSRLEDFNLDADLPAAHWTLVQVDRATDHAWGKSAACQVRGGKSQRNKTSVGAPR